MIYTIFKISIRNLLKHKIYSFINVFGLALGFTAFILIGLFVQYDLSWDNYIGSSYHFSNYPDNHQLPNCKSGYQKSGGSAAVRIT